MLSNYLHARNSRHYTSRKGTDASYLAAIVDSSDDAIVGKDLKGIVTSWNRSATEIFGYTADEIIGQHISLLFPPDRLSDGDIILGMILCGTRVEHYRTVRRCKDGSDIHVSLTVSPIRDSLGNIVGASKILRNIGTQIEFERLRSDRDERFLRVVEAVPSGLVTVDASGRIEMVNANTLRMFGYTSGELIGRSIECLLPERLRGAHGALRHGYLGDPETRAMGAGGDLYGLHKDGTEFRVEIGLNQIKCPAGQTLVLASIVDITERCRMEAALLESEAKYRRIVDDGPLGIILVELPGLVIRQVNRAYCEMLGYSPEELVGAPISDFTHPEDRGMAETGRDSRSHNGIVFEKRYVTKAGAVVWARVTGTVLRDTKAPTDQLLAVVEDITQRKLVEQQLLQAQKMEAVGQLTGGLAHDFNNLLSVILGNLEFLHEMQEPGGDQFGLTEEAIHAAWRGAELTRQLLAFARQQPLAAKVTDLNLLLSGTTRLLGRTLGEQVTLGLQVAEDLWPVLVDATQLESAILNLAVNARDAMPAGGHLMVEAKNVVLDKDDAHLGPDVTPGCYVALAISDTGTGMSPEVVAKAFNPFYSTKGTKGTGLGLSMVHGFVKQSGGHTNIYSEPGQGTTIRMYFPRSRPQEIDAGAVAATADLATGNEIILVVEDNKSLCDVALRQLQSMGYRTIPAADGPRALEIVRGGAPIDLLFTDVVMPGGLDGRALAAAARKLRPDLKVLFTSGFTASAASAATGDAFGFNLLSKPYRKVDLSQRVRATLDGSGR